MGFDRDAGSPFRYNREWALGRIPDLTLLKAEAASVLGEHTFLAFAVKGTAPADDDHRCEVRHCAWVEREGGAALEIAANRFLHHMVRFLVATMVEVGLGRRTPGSVAELLRAADNRDVAAPAPACGLYLERVTYPTTLYLAAAPAVAA